MQKKRKDPSDPTEEELAEIAHAVAGTGDVEPVLEKLREATSARMPVLDGPPFFGKPKPPGPGSELFVVVWSSGRTEEILHLSRNQRGVLELRSRMLWNKPDKPEVREWPAGDAASDVWGEDDRFPREDWIYEVQNGNTSLGYWDWVISMRRVVC